MSPRPPLPLGTWGKIRRQRVASGRWHATARYRDTDGVTRAVEAWGDTGAAAERALVTMLKDRQAPTKSEITQSMRLSELGALWFAEIESNGRAGRRMIDG
ncbi:hypothetical protein [Arthrobacter sp. ISL-30]|uniref:hypothetical protein n=1 Tax=Arthrobacter sp. ISL-30 TaxID=2819109 RepID=UPI001BEBBAFB|nr:hypothetical protein [Arthrobacter sp. ISL-30]MBT2515463.1 hypothetical protein [Arthrobacter sp. ISL-30]